MAIVRTLLAVLQVHVLIEESASCWLQNPSQWEALPPKAVSMASKAHPSLKTRGSSDWCFSVRTPQWFPRPPSTLWQLILFHLPSLLLPFTPGQALHGTWCISQPSLAPSPYSLPGISLANICIGNLLPCITQTNLVQFSSVQSLSHVWLFETPWTAACQASLSITNSWSLLKFMSIKSVMPSKHLSLSSPSPPAFNLSQHQGLFKWVSSSHQVAKVLEFQLQHQISQWIFRTDFL